jgi:hypothetical protein
LRKLVGRVASRGRVAAARGGKIAAVRGAMKKEKKPPKYSIEPELTPKEKKEFDLVRYLNRPIKKAEGGKVGSAMTALRQLAKEYKAAVMMDDKETADRIRRRMELVKPGSSREVDKASDQSGRETKLATFAKGGKVGRLARIFRARMDDREGYIREGFGASREEAHANLRKEVAHDNGEETVDALLKEHGVTYKRSKK